MAKTHTRRSVKVDPIVALVATADRVLEEYVKVANALHAARAKLAPRDRYSPSISPPLGQFLQVSPWRSDFLFTSLDHIDREFRRVTKRLKEEIGETRRKKIPSEGLIAYNQMVLAILPRLKGPLEKKFRAERRRVLAAQQKVGLIDMHKRERKAWMALHAITRQISKAKPTTAAGALALVRYVQGRSPRYDDFFNDQPAEFDKVLRTAMQRLEHSVAA